MKNTAFSRISRASAVAAAAAAAFSVLAPVAFAQMPGQHGTDHAGHASQVAPMGNMAASGGSPSTKAFQASDEKMMKDMGVAYTGDADKDFVSHMIPHHQGAVSMAEVQLQYGKDPALRKMAQEIVKAQQNEIAFMKRWQAKNGVKSHR